MSVWCGKCGKRTFNEVKCDHCKSYPKDKSKSYTKQKENTYQNKKNRGDEYEAYIAEHYTNLGYLVTEHGKEQGVKDGGIDLIAEKNNEVILIQCKDWNENNSHKIDHKDIKVLRVDGKDFLDRYPKYINKTIRLRYTLSGSFLHPSAKKHMQECRENIDYEVIKPIYREKEESRQNYTNKSFKKKKKKKKEKINTEVEKMVIGIIAMIVIFVFLTPNNKTEKQEVVNDTKNTTINKYENNIKSKEVNKIVASEKIYENVSNRLVQSKNDLTPETRYSTNTKTKEVKCNRAWWQYFKESSHIIATTEKENREIKSLLSKKNINYPVILRQRVRNITLNEKEMRNRSCSEKYFKQLMKKEKIIKKVKKENEVLKDLMVMNGIENKKIIYYNQVKKRKEKPKLNMVITDNSNSDEDLKRAIKEMN